MSTQLFKECYDISLGLDETKACGPIAVSIATTCPLTLVLELFKREGRSPRTGVNYTQCEKVLNKLGYFVEDKEWYPKQENGSRFTLKTISKNRKNGIYIVFTTSHAACMINGVIHDWASDTKRRVECVWAIV